jgi:hypothetical protein
VKEIAAHNDKIDLFSDSIPLQYIDPRVEKIARALSQLVSRASEMHIGDMEKLHEAILSFIHWII